jgi:hypothetical protein
MRVFFWFIFSIASIATLASTALMAADPKAESDKSSAKAKKRPLKLYKVGREAIEQSFLRPQRYDFTDKSLEYVLDYLADRTGVAFVMDHKTIFDEEKEPNEHTIFRAVNRGDPLDVGFTNIVTATGLAWTIHDEVILVTTKTAARRYMEPRVYSLSRPLQAAEMDKLIDDIVKKVAPTTWQEMGGQGGISTLSPTVVVVLQNYENQRKLTQEFGQVLRPVAARPRPKGKTPPTKGADPAAITRALAEPTVCDFEETPLSDIAESLAARHKISIKLDEKALNVANVATFVPMTLRVQGIKLASALSLMLEPFKLAVIPDQAGLLITSKAVADAKLLKVVYPVQDLAVGGSFEKLVEVIVRSVNPVTWTDVGGPASILPDANQGVLTIDQNFAGQMAIEQLLADLRAAR